MPRHEILVKALEYCAVAAVVVVVVLFFFVEPLGMLFEGAVCLCEAASDRKVKPARLKR